MLTYFAILHKNDSSHVATFPDFPTCQVPSELFEEAYGSAAAALRAHVRGMVERGGPLEGMIWVIPAEPLVITIDRRGEPE